MNLTALRRIAVKQNLRIRFALGNGMECVLNEHSIAQVPLHAVPDFNLEEELKSAQAFLVEPATAAVKEKTKTKPRHYTRDEMAALASAAPSGDARHEEHEE